MASVTVFSKGLRHMVLGNLPIPNGVQTRVKIALEGPSSTYSPDKAAHETFTAIKALGSNPFVEVATGGYTVGYTAGGASVPSIAVAINGNNIEATFTDTVWAASTISAIGAVIYDSVTDYLIGYIDFGGTVTSSNNDFTIDFTQPLRFANNS